MFYALEIITTFATLFLFLSGILDIDIQYSPIRRINPLNSKKKSFWFGVYDNLFICNKQNCIHVTINTQVFTTGISENT